MLQNNPALKSKIDQLWNKFWAGGIANPLTAIEQITYLLFMKRLDDLDLKQQADADFPGDSFTSRFAGTWVPPEHRFTSNKKDPRKNFCPHYHAKPDRTLLPRRISLSSPFWKAAIDRDCSPIDTRRPLG
jgi:type I restriction enzyme M protein